MALDVASHGYRGPAQAPPVGAMCSERATRAPHGSERAHQGRCAAKAKKWWLAYTFLVAARPERVRSRACLGLPGPRGREPVASFPKDEGAPLWDPRWRQLLPAKARRSQRLGCSECSLRLAQCLQAFRRAKAHASRLPLHPLHFYSNSLRRRTHEGLIGGARLSARRVVTRAACRSTRKQVPGPRQQGSWGSSPRGDHAGAPHAASALF